MFKNYLKTAFRTLTRQRSYTAINILGLALGLACCFLIALYVRDELSYDAFHAKGDRIVFVGLGTPGEGGFMATPYPLAEALEREVPGVKRAVRMFWPGSSGKVSREGDAFTEEHGVYHAEHGFFELFSFPFVSGDPQAALTEPNTVVLSKALAQKYFPGEDPVGETLQIEARGREQTYRVVGVAQSRKNSYLDFGAVLSFSTLDYAESHGDQWESHMFLTFALLDEHTSQETFEQRATALLQKHSDRAVFALPIADLYLSELVTPDGFRGEMRYIYLFGAVALFILLLACVNYVNLSTARSAERAKEVGVRRTVGAGRAQVARQFLGESVLLSLGAFAVAIAMARAALPVFNYLFDKELSLFANGNGAFLLLLFGAAVSVGLLAGAYPALYLSSFQPTEVLRGHARRIGRGTRLRKGLVVAQFAVAVALLAATAVVFQQLRYAQQKDLGFEKEQVITLDGLPDELEALRREVLAHPAVRSASIANAVPGRFGLTLSLNPETISSQARTQEAALSFKPAVVDTSFVETLGLRLAAGRVFSGERTSDQHAFLLNEAFAEGMGWTSEEAIGKVLDLNGTSGEVIGVVENFHLASLREDIAPVVMSLSAFEGVSSFPILAVRFQPGRTKAVLDYLEATWAKFSDEPLDYTFLDDAFAEMYRTERRLGQVFTAFAVIAVLIACLGLFGLAAFAAEARTKEIGIRKVLGASAASIVALLSKDFAQLVLFAFVLAVPLAWIGMSKWLEDFAYRIELSPWLFLLAGAAALLIALLTVSYQALKAATANPTEALQSE